jgi:hypothetical protein
MHSAKRAEVTSKRYKEKIRQSSGGYPLWCRGGMSFMTASNGKNNGSKKKKDGG